MKRGHTPSNWKPEAVTGNDIGDVVMRDRERLEQIQQESITDAIEYGCQHGSRSQVKTDRIVEDVKWLIEQAERTQSVEEESEILKVGALHTANLHHFLQSNRHLLQLKSLGKDVRESAIDTIVALDEENKRLRKALAFYADEGNYVLWNGMAMSQKEIERDQGKKAKKALEGEQ